MSEKSENLSETNDDDPIVYAKQPTRSKRVTKERRFDRTQLRAGGHGRTVHRDYAAHAFRWNFIAREVQKVQEPLMGAWLAGLVDGEGSFCIGVSENEKGHRHVAFTFQLGLRGDDTESLQYAQQILGRIGSINPVTVNETVYSYYKVSGMDEIAQVVEFFRLYPLASKKGKHFEIWAEAFDLYYGHPRKHRYEAIPDELFQQIKKYKAHLEEVRKYPSRLPETLEPRNPNYIKDVFLKYGWVPRQIKAGESILDVGCGQDQKLLYILGSRIQTVPDIYVGVDLNSIPNKSHVNWADIYDNFDFVTNGATFLEPKYTPFDKAVCFEVIEHMQPPDGRRLLDNVHRLLRPGGILYLSTPVFNGSAAANHIHEYTIPELRSAVEAAGFKVQRRIGTFASKPDVKPVLNPCQTQLYDEMEEWFGGDVMSTIFAYNHPDNSRNNLWVLEKP